MIYFLEIPGKKMDTKYTFGVSICIKSIQTYEMQDRMNLARFAHNWNVGILECWNTGWNCYLLIACPVEFSPLGGTPCGGFHRADIFHRGYLLFE